MTIVAKRVYNHYELYVDEEFCCSCDVEELNSTISEIKKEKQKDLHLVFDDV